MPKSADYEKHSTFFFTKDESKIEMHLTMKFLDGLVHKEGPYQEVLRFTKWESVIVGESDCSIVILVNPPIETLTI